MGTRTESTFRIGLDDTDHPDGGCTTFDLNSLADLLVSEVPSFREIETVSYTHLTLPTSHCV